MLKTNKKNLSTVVNAINKVVNQFSYNPVKNLLSAGDTNVKTAKNNIKTYILYMAPADTLPGFNLCPFASPGCKKSCLYSAGRGKFNNVQTARINKSKFWAYDRAAFYVQLTNEILKINSSAKKFDYITAIRLNGTSDIDHIDLIKRYTGVEVLKLSNVIFYDYTKNPNHVRKYLNSNYKLTFSRSEINENTCLDILQAGGNVAAVFAGELPEFWNGYKVINGDETDLRYFDPVNVVVGLKAKGDAKKDKSNFVITKY